MSATEYAIGRHCGVTFAGLKIASLVSLRKGEHRARLTKYLFSPDVMAFLARFGYEYACAEEALRQLKERMNGEFPHEIGVFLGYPLGDVCGFLRDPDGCILCGAWKVYENVGEAARTFERFRRCSACICRHMDRGRSLTQIFNIG